MLVGAGMVVVVVAVEVLVSCEIIVAAPGCLVVTVIVLGISSSIFGEARSHFTRKCRASVDHEVTTVGELHSSSSYQSSASESDLQ